VEKFLGVVQGVHSNPAQKSGPYWPRRIFKKFSKITLYMKVSLEASLERSTLYFCYFKA